MNVKKMLKVDSAVKVFMAFFVVLVATVSVAQSAAQPAARPRPRSGLLGSRLAPQAQPQATNARNSAEDEKKNSKEVEPGGRSIEFNQAPVEMVFKVYGELKGVTVLKDPQSPSATITLQPLQGQELSDEEKILAIETILEMNGIHLEPYGDKFYRALPRKDVRKDGIPLIMDSEAELDDSTHVVSVMLPFKNISIEEGQKVLEGFKSASGLLLVFERINSILITDTKANINRMREIARTIDVPTPVTENVYVRQIRHAVAADIKTALEAIVQKSKEEQEKDGKQPSPAAQNRPASPFLRRNLLQRNAAPQAPANQASIVTSVSDADRGMIRGKVLILSDERSNKLIIVTSKSNMDFFDKVIEQLDVETIPPTVVKVYRLKYADAEDVSDMINDLIGNAPSGKSGSKSGQNAAAKTSSAGGANMTTGRTTPTRQSANKRTGEPQAGELSKENTTILADKRINGLVVMTQKELVPTVESIIEAMDIKLSQVLIETVIIEVALSDTLKTGIDWFHGMKQKGGRYNSGLAGGGGTGSPRAGSTESTGGSTDSGTTEGSTGSGSTSGTKAAAETALSLASDAVASTPAGAGINYFVHSGKLDLSAIITASKTDNRTKYLASPIVMTVDNKEATIEATSTYQFLTGWSAVSSSYSGSGMPSPNYTEKDLGITLKIKPKINPNGTVMLNVEEEYSQLGTKQPMLQPTGSNTGYTEAKVDTSVTRKMTSDIILENQQSVILGGLNTKNIINTESGIPILKDIPWVGKWLFGSTEKTENRAELLIFMTPYVLDDADAAKAEAIRRKKTLSDPNPWDDGGWSASELSDPVSQKELMRRLKDEWKKQDAERKTKLAIEQAKVERVRKLRALSEEERAVWLKMHKEELEKEAREELEEKMLDDESQAELKKLAAGIRKSKLEEAEREIEAARKDLEEGPVKKTAPASGKKDVKADEPLLPELEK